MSSHSQLAAALRELGRSLIVLADVTEQQTPAPGALAPARGLTVRQAAERLGVSEKHVRREVAASRLRAVRVGARLLIPEAEIAKVLS